ncbi:hypothetical protein AAY473_022810, partial [Plecturocebus cupreus]
MHLYIQLLGRLRQENRFNTGEYHNLGPGTVAHTCNSNIWEVEVGGSFEHFGKPRQADFVTILSNV